MIFALDQHGLLFSSPPKCKDAAHFGKLRAIRHCTLFGCGAQGFSIDTVLLKRTSRDCTRMLGGADDCKTAHITNFVSTPPDPCQISVCTFRYQSPEDAALAATNKHLLQIMCGSYAWTGPKPNQVSSDCSGMVAHRCAHASLEVFWQSLPWSF